MKRNSNRTSIVLATPRPFYTSRGSKIFLDAGHRNENNLLLRRVPLLARPAVLSIKQPDVQDFSGVAVSLSGQASSGTPPIGKTITAFPYRVFSYLFRARLRVRLPFSRLFVFLVANAFPLSRA
jgi:hypothetical protein